MLTTSNGWPGVVGTDENCLGLGWPKNELRPNRSFVDLRMNEPTDQETLDLRHDHYLLVKTSQEHSETSLTLNQESPRYSRQLGLAQPIAETETEDQGLVSLHQVDTTSSVIPAETRIIAVANQKGGVGKTTSAVNIAAALAQKGAQVLVIDLDPQGNASTALAVEHHSGVLGIYESLIGGSSLSEVMKEVEDFPSMRCVPATVDLAGAEIELVPVVARELRLRRAIDSYLKTSAEVGEKRLDYVFIDCPPSLGLLTVNALVAAKEVFIPIQCEYYALEGLGQLINNIELVKVHLNPDLRISSILLTMFDSRTKLSAQVADEVRAHFQDAVLPTVIPRSVRISEAPSHSQTVLIYDPSSSGAWCYMQAALEFVDRAAQNQGKE